MAKGRNIYEKYAIFSFSEKIRVQGKKKTRREAGAASITP
jgi:hypothetical protein